MKVLIVGIGALGGTIAARAISAGVPVRLATCNTDYAKALRSSTGMSLRLAADKKLKTVAFPAVGTGIAGFPLRECAEIMIDEVVRHLAGATSVEKVYFVLFEGTLFQFEMEVIFLKALEDCFYNFSV